MSNPKVSRQIQFFTAYKESDLNLSNKIKDFVGDKPYRLHIQHHSHLLKTHLVNATAYNTARTNGLCIALLEVDSKIIGVGYSFCSVKDNYSRLIGRVQAKESLLNVLNGTKGFDFNLEGKQALEPYRYINKLVQAFAAKPKPKTKKPYIHPLTFHVENDLTLEMKQLISKTFGVDSKSIMQHFFYIRRYENRLITGQYATHDYIKNIMDTHIDDEVTLKDTGGLTIGVVSFIKDDKRMLLVGTSCCSIEDTFVKSLGRKTIIKNIADQLAENDKPAKTRPVQSYQVPSDTPYDSILQSIPTIISAEFYDLGVNNYIPVNK